MNDSPITRLELITIALTAGFLSPTFGNLLADMLSAAMVGLMLLVLVLWMKYGRPLL